MMRAGNWKVALLGMVMLSCGDEGVPLPQIQLTAMSVKPGGVVLSAGRSRRFLAELIDDTGQRFNVTSTATWSSSDPAIVRADGDGVSVGVAPGTATVSAARDGQTGQAMVQVLAAPVTSVALGQGPLQLGPNATGQLQAVATLDNGMTEDVTALSAWKCDNVAVAKVAGGRVTALGPGTAMIRATADMIESGPVVVTVMP